MIDEVEVPSLRSERLPDDYFLWRAVEFLERSVSDIRESFSHRSRDLVIRPIGVLLAYECLFEATHRLIQIALGDPTLPGRHLSKSRDLHLSGLRSMVHPSVSTASSRKLKRGHSCPRPHQARQTECAQGKPPTR